MAANIVPNPTGRPSGRRSQRGGINHLLQTGERREETSHVQRLKSEFDDCDRIGSLQHSQQSAMTHFLFLSKSLLIINLPSDVRPLLVIERYAIWSGLEIPGAHFPVTGDVSGARWHHLVSMLAFLTPPDHPSTSSRALQVIANANGAVSKFHAAYQLIGGGTAPFLGLIRQRSVARQPVAPFSAGFFISVMK